MLKESRKAFRPEVLVLESMMDGPLLNVLLGRHELHATANTMKRLGLVPAYFVPMSWKMMMPAEDLTTSCVFPGGVANPRHHSNEGPNVSDKI